MSAKGPVSILWQIFFAVFIPIADIWEFYRIKKLRRAILYIALPSLALMMIVLVPISSIMIEAGDNSEKMDQLSEDFASDVWLNTISMVASIASIGVLIWTVYLVATWSKQWNKQFENPENKN
ncbi:MAG: hypothetical protein ACR2LL_11580 [Nitrosopumilus sp.]